MEHLTILLDVQQLTDSLGVYTSSTFTAFQIFLFADECNTL